ncbi:hypothetical protein ABW20_dc0104628 [Dactylellina cionopaga]|nr:hypothetical protein ABW20_dc0104628 [Dactylellina cionopaga]
MHAKLILATLFAAAASSVQAHSVIVAAVGNAGGPVGAALGMDPSVPRTGTAPAPFQVDSTTFNGQRSVAAAKGCGSTAKGGPNKVGALVKAMAAAGTIAQIAPGGELRMTLHQVNGDGAGPYICMVDTTGKGANFVPLMVSQQVAGAGGNSGRDASTNALFVQFAAATRCTGAFGDKTNVCMVRCQNEAGAGPFGGCVPVQILDDAAKAAEKAAADQAAADKAAGAAPAPNAGADNAAAGAGKGAAGKAGKGKGGKGGKGAAAGKAGKANKVAKRFIAF